MSSTSASPSRICPVCKAGNSAYSLFCAECGVALNDEPADSTAALPSARDTTQATQAFSPAIDPWRSDPQPAVNPPQESWSAPAAPGPVTWPGERTSETATIDDPGSARGFFLGLLAVILIAVVFGLYLWTSEVSAGTRDNISGWFDFIG